MIKGKRDMNGIKKPIDGVKKRCFECFGWFKVSDFKLIFTEGMWFRGDYCNTCLPLTQYRVKIKPTLQDFEQMRFVDMFMGTASYKDVCKLAKIRYEK